MKAHKYVFFLTLLISLNACNKSKDISKTVVNNDITLPNTKTSGALMEISAEALLKMLKYDKSAFVIDVRKPDKKIRSCKLIKGYKHLEDSIIYKNPNILPKGKSIVLLSKKGERSRKLAKFLEKKGITVYNLKGGMDSYWEWRANIIREKLHIYDKEIDVIELYADDFGC